LGRSRGGDRTGPVDLDDLGRVVLAHVAALTPEGRRPSRSRRWTCAWSSERDDLTGAPFLLLVLRPPPRDDAGRGPEDDNDGMARGYVSAFVDGVVTASLGRRWADRIRAVVDGPVRLAWRRSPAVGSVAAGSVQDAGGPVGGGRSAPSSGVVAALRSIDALKGRTVLDLCGGDGNLAAWCARKGARRITIVDLRPPSPPPHRACGVVRADVAEFTPAGSYDLLLFDPPHDVAARLALRVREATFRAAPRWILNLGYAAMTESIAEARDRLGRCVPATALVVDDGVATLVGGDPAFVRAAASHGRDAP